MQELFGVMTFDLINERRTNGTVVPLRDQMVNAIQMRGVIGDFLQHVADAFKSGSLLKRARLAGLVREDVGMFTGLILGALADLCFNLEYCRRVTGHRWAYCDKGPHPRAF